MNIEKLLNGVRVHSCIVQCTSRWFNACPFRVGNCSVHATVVYFITTAWVSCGQYWFYQCGSLKALLCLPYFNSSALLAELESTECFTSTKPRAPRWLCSVQYGPACFRGGCVKHSSHSITFNLCVTCCTVVASMFTHCSVGSCMAFTRPGELVRWSGFYPGCCSPIHRASTGLTGAGAVSTGFTGADIHSGPMKTML